MIYSQTKRARKNSAQRVNLHLALGGSFERNR